MPRALGLIFALCLWPFWTTFGLASETLANDHVSQSISVSLTGDDGDIRVTTRIEAPQGNIRLPRTDWLQLSDMSVDGQPIAPAETAMVPAGLHKGKPFTATLTGRLPPLTGTPRTAAFSDDASYLIGADWFPTDDRALHRFEITLDVPPDQTAVATGSRRAAQTDAERYSATFTFEGRATDIGIFTGVYEMRETQRDGRALRTYFASDDTDLSEAYLDAAAGYIQEFETRVGPYPYTSFSIVSAPIPVGLGFAGLTYVSQSILAHPYMRGRSLAHEVLHSWWGNAVAVDYASGNWAEGLTTYQADHAMAETQGQGAAAKMRIDWLRALADLPPDANRPLTAFQSSSHDGQQAVGYGKAALVFHMLREDIGPNAFDAGIRDFYTTQKHRVASWADLQAAFERASQRDLGWFFDQWLTRAGLPEISLTEVRTPDERSLRLTLAQTRPHYRLRVPVRIDTTGGTVVDVIELQSGSATRDIALPGTPTKVTVDPDFALARQLLQEETAPILAEALFSSELQRLDMELSRNFQTAATQLAGRIRGMSRFKMTAPLDKLGTGPVAVIGDTISVAALRDRLIAMPSPSQARAGTARAWAERDASGQVFLFISGDSPENLGGALEKLGYFGQRSFVAFDDGEQVASGNWPVRDSPMVRDLR